MTKMATVKHPADMVTTEPSTEPTNLDLTIAIELAQRRRAEFRDMLAVWLLARQREGVKVVWFNEPHLATLMRLCVEADEALVQAAAKMIERQP